MTTPGAPEPVGAADGKPWSENDLTAIRAFVTTAVVDGDFLFQGDPLFVTRRWLATLAAARAEIAKLEQERFKLQQLIDEKLPEYVTLIGKLRASRAQIAGALVKVIEAARTRTLSNGVRFSPTVEHVKMEDEALEIARAALAPDGAGT